jgi:uncharacterized protein (DUF697 family)
MSRKNFPKAVTRTADDMREGAAADWPTTQLPLDSSPRRVAVPEPEPAGNVVAMLPTVADSPPPQGGREQAEAAVAHRHALAARLIVERHATYAALGGFIPLPILDFSAVAAIILRMVKVLSNHYGVPFQRDRARAIVIALMAGAAPAGLGTVTASTLSFFVPGGLFVGLAVSSVTATACTRAVGRIFVEHFESGATLADFSIVSRR